MTQDLRDALRAEYERAHDALRPEGVAAVRAGAVRRGRRQKVAAAAVLALALAGGAAGWRLADGDAQRAGEPGMQVAGPGCDRPGLDLSVFLVPQHTQEQADGIERALLDSPEVYCLRFETQEEAWERFKKQFSDAPDLVTATKMDSLPESFRFRVAKRAEMDAVGWRVETLPGVSDYICQGCYTETPRR